LKTGAALKLSIFTDAQVKEYREKFCNNEITIDQICEFHPSITRATIRNFLRGKTYKTAGGPVAYRGWRDCEAVFIVKKS
jgi:hypothetical protein